jgi:hypothetical protein
MDAQIATRAKRNALFASLRGTYAGALTKQKPCQCCKKKAGRGYTDYGYVDARPNAPRIVMVLCGRCLMIVQGDNVRSKKLNRARLRKNNGLKYTF